ncbi:TMV resistance protein N-like [Corylus avellana]|uniref:TMV resistance protein N-like n=1 Tax=Corylus avellana TaxID=13451 RepID=UPI00286D379B|nr:TMV resistance protein N-like [Corylus avellana]
MELIGLESLTEIPDISGIPNLQKLRVDECKSLVKVHDSIGLLKKLTDLHFLECSNLITLPRSLKLRSLETLWFHYCARIENFPKIDRKMERLEQLVLRGIAIKELPSSIVHLTGLFDLHIEDCKNLVHLPSSLQLQPLNNLRHERCSKVDKLPTKVRDERESMLSDPSIEESEISSSTKLFPSLKLLVLDISTRLIKPEFFMTLDCFSGLDRLSLSESDIVRLPTCIKRFVRLRHLFIMNCKRLEEIPELPPSIEDIVADGCVSLESFPDLSKTLQFNTSGLRARVVKWLGLFECDKLAVNIGNHVENTLWDKEIGYQLGSAIVRRVHMTVTRAMDINGLPDLDEIKGIAFCAVFGPTLGFDLDENTYKFSLAISSKGVEIETRERYIAVASSDRVWKVSRSNHVWLEYLVLEPVVLEEDNLQVRFSISSGLSIISCGVHLIHKHEENAKDHPSLTHVDFNFCLQSFGDESDECDEESDNPECSAEEDDCDDEDEDDCNLESSY